MIIRSEKKDNYFVLPNNIANDNRLKPEAVSVLIYLLSKPNDWKVYPKQVAAAKEMSEKAVYKAIRQLIEIGYIEREAVRGKSRIERWEYKVYDVPQDIFKPATNFKTATVADSVKLVAQNRKAKNNKADFNLVENNLVEFNLVDLGTHYNKLNTDIINTNKISTILNNITDSGESVASVQATPHIVNKKIADKTEHKADVNINDSLTMRQKQQTATKEPFYISRTGRKLTGETLERFNDFWSAFDFKQGKADAADEFLNVSKRLSLSSADYEKIIKAAKQEAVNRPLLIGQGRQAKWAAGWLAGRRWEDEQQAITATTGDIISNGTGFNGALNNTLYPVQAVSTGSTGFTRSNYYNSFTPVYGEMTPYGFPSTGSRKKDNAIAAGQDAIRIRKEMIARREVQP